MTPNSSTINFDPAIPTDWEKSTYYTRDAQGNVMAIYEYTIDDVTQDNHYTLTERNIYGSSRLGNNNAPVEMIATTPPNPSQYSHHIGYRQYELSNHLGSVRVVISDLKQLNNQGDLTTIDANDYFSPSVLSFSDTYPFGMSMRDFNPNEMRYFFQGQEKEKDAVFEGLAFKYRIHDARIGRFLSIDPLFRSFPHNSSYAFSENRVIDALEVEGLQVVALGTSDTYSFGGSKFTSEGVLLDFSKPQLALYSFKTVGYGVESAVSIAQHRFFAYYPNADVSQLSGDGVEVSVGGGEGFISGAVGISYSVGPEGKIDESKGRSFSIGGTLSFPPISGDFYETNTSITPLNRAAILMVSSHVIDIELLRIAEEKKPLEVDVIYYQEGLNTNNKIIEEVHKKLEVLEPNSKEWKNVIIQELIPQLEGRRNNRRKLKEVKEELKKLKDVEKALEVLKSNVAKEKSESN
ncbi:MAG: hypothetical protein RQ875_03955 [Vicingaceae bacterium]|nr:hypothetical protein [Vicingaceae bacterium]